MSAKPFLFDQAFDGLDPTAPHPPAGAGQPQVYDEAAMDAERQASFAAGYAEGETAARAEAEAAAAQAEARTLDAIAGGLGGMLAAMDDAQSAAAAAATIAASQALARAFPAFARAHGDDEVLATIRDALASAFDEPRLVIRLAEADFERIEPNLAEVAQRAGYPGRLVTLDDGEIAPGDVRVEWADGGVIRDAGRMTDAIAQAFEGLAASIAAGDDHSNPEQEAAADPAIGA